MLKKDSVSDASRLLDLGGLAVDRLESDTSGCRVVHMVTADECASTCPSCGVFSDSLKGRVCTRPRDIPYGTRILRLIWHKRRWRCKERLCARSSFTEQVPAVRKRSRLTTRLRTELGHAIAEQGRTVAESAAHYGVGWSIVHAAFAAHVRAPLAAPLPAVKVLGFALMSAPLDAPVELHDAISLRLGGGGIASVGGASTCVGADGNKHHLVVEAVGSTGQFQVDVFRERVALFRPLSGRIELKAKPDDGIYDGALAAQCLVDLALGKPVANPAPGELGARTVEALELAYRSAASGLLETRRVPA